MLKLYRVFVASPGDVPSERKAIDKAIDEINQTNGDALGYRLESVRWETHTAPGGGRPQQVVNDLIGRYDIFIGIMWRRFGTPTGVAGSGTEEEFRIAYRAWEQSPEMPLMFYFCQRPFMPRKTDELDQIRQVLNFHEELNGKTLAWEYPTPSKFPDLIRKHLCIRANKLAEPRNRVPRAKADGEQLRILKELWPRMAADLKDSLSAAYNENRLAGNGGIKTEDLFAAFQRLQPEPLKLMLEEINKEKALPEPISGPVVENHYIVEEQPWLSHCVATSIHRLSKILPPGRELTAADVFADIAKNGTGSSVRKLREHKIGPEQIDQLLRRTNTQVIAT